MPDLRNRNWISRLCNGGLLLIACLACGILLGLNVAYNVVITEAWKEQVVILPGAARGLGLLAVTILLPIGAGLLPQKPRVGEKTCFALLSGVYTAMALYLMLNADSALRDDPQMVYESATAFLRGDYQAFEKGGYMSYCPHQVGLMLYDALIYSLSRNPIGGVIANFCFILGIQYLVWRVTDTLFHSSGANLAAMGLSFAFLPQFFFITFLYGTIPGFFFLMLAFYLTLRFAQEGRFWQLLAAGLSIGIAVMLRKNNIIGVAAMGIFLFLQWLEKPKKPKLLGAACFVVLLAVVPNQLTLMAVEAKTGCDLHRGMPAILHIQMGTNIENRKLGPGWWDGSNLHIFAIEADYDPAEASESGRWYLKENLRKIEEKPYNAARFFWDKVVSTWCDPLYQSVWSGPMEEWGQNTHTELLRSIYTGGGAWSVFETFCKWVTLTLWAFAFVYLLAFRRGQTLWQLCYLYTIGGALFHFVWETKSQYVYPYVFCLIPFAAYAFVQTARKCGEIVRRFRREK